MTQPSPSNPKVTKIHQVLRTLLKTSPYVRAAAVIRLSGITVAAEMPYYVEQDRVSAMSAVMLLLGERMNLAMRSGELGKVYIQGANGHIVLISVTGDAVLSVMADQEAPLGLVFLEMEHAIRKLKPLV